MISRISALFRPVRQILRDVRAVSTVVVAASGVAIMGMAGFALDVGMGEIAKSQLQAATNASVLNIAYQWANMTTVPTQTQLNTWASTWRTNYPTALVSSVSGNPSLLCVTSTTNLTSCSAATSTYNVVSLTQTGTAPVRFFPILGISSLNISATAKAAVSGGQSAPLNVMFIIDATGSMSNTDSNCTVPNHSGSVTKFQCAEYGIQQVMMQFLTPQDKVGIMTFPGMASQWVPCGTQPSSVKYGSSTIYYQIDASTLDTSYVNGSGVLQDTTPLVKAIGDNANSVSGCLSNKGGEGTYYGEVISKAQAALVAQGSANAKDVIIFLSDGDANASSSESTVYSNECQAGVTAATAAKTAGTTIYSVAYDSPTSGSCSTDTGTYAGNACAAMQDIATAGSTFFVSASSGTSACTYGTTTLTSGKSSPNNYANIATAFKQVGMALSKPRLLTN